MIYKEIDIHQADYKIRNIHFIKMGLKTEFTPILSYIIQDNPDDNQKFQGMPHPRKRSIGLGMIDSYSRENVYDAFQDSFRSEG